MNAILLDPAELTPSGRVTMTDGRRRHLLDVLKVVVGSTVRVGVIDGDRGTARIVAITADEIVMEVTLDEPALARPDTNLVLAMPRPKVFGRILEHVAAAGVRRVIVVNSWRVEKSYFQTDMLEASAIRQRLVAGLELARDTWMPEVHVFKRFKPFVEDTLDSLTGAGDRLILHPGAETPLTRRAASPGPLTVAIGPEGGWIPYEVDLLKAHGFNPTTLGPRIMRVEAACVVALWAIQAAVRGAAPGEADPISGPDRLVGPPAGGHHGAEDRTCRR